MPATAAHRSQELSDAFERFAQMSEHLTASYQQLERQVTGLNAELERERDNRIVQLEENARLTERLRAVLAALPAALVVLDGAGRVQDCNPAASEYLGEPLIGIEWREVIRRAFVPRADDGHDISLADGRRVSIATRPLGVDPGQILLLTDVSEMRRLRDALDRRQRLTAMGEMAAALAHQVRTPLAAALLYASHLGRPGLAVAEQQRVIGRIQDRIRHLESLINDMLLFARSGRFEVEPVRLGELLEAARLAVEPQLAGQDARLTIDRVDAALVLRVNRGALLSALQNLITNSLQACGAGARIALAAQPVSAPGALALVDITVTDNGPGIAPEQLARIFEPFYTTRDQGSGLGLAVVRAIAEAHGGAAWARSEPGRGSCLGIRLPLAADQADITGSGT